MKNIFDTRRVRPTEVLIHNNYADTIPAKSFVRITSYNKTLQHFDVNRPDGDGMENSEIAIVPEEILVDELGIAIIEGIGVVTKTAGETIAAGDIVGTDKDEFTGIFCDGGFKVLYYDSGGDMVLTKTTGGRIRSAFCKTDVGASQTLVCYLDTDITGEEITVNFFILGGGNLNTAMPLLFDGDEIPVIKIDEDWYCIWPMQPLVKCNCLDAYYELALGADPSPESGSIYWHEASNRIYIYNFNTTTWKYVQLS